MSNDGIHDAIDLVLHARETDGEMPRCRRLAAGGNGQPDGQQKDQHGDRQREVA